jgi:cystathionine beta-lyase/cystathionine gamma-synthase
LQLKDLETVEKRLEKVNRAAKQVIRRLKQKALLIALERLYYKQNQLEP